MLNLKGIYCIINLGDTMERSLSLVLNGRQSNIMFLQDTIMLTLETKESKELDEYISKSFNSSDEIRKKYADIISAFLKQHQNMIQRIENETGKKYSGSIVITEFHDDLTLERKRVIYKKDIILFKEITKNKKFVLELENRDYINYQKNKQEYTRIFSDFFGKELRFNCTSDAKYNRVLGQWRNAIKGAFCYYDIIRRVLKEYESRYKDLGLDSLDVIYSKYTGNKQKKIMDDVVQEIEQEIVGLEKVKAGDRLEKDLLMHLSDYEEEPREYEEDPRRISKVYNVDGYPGDLEDWSTDRHIPNEEGISFQPFVLEDYEESELEKTKTKVFYNKN